MISSLPPDTCTPVPTPVIRAQTQKTERRGRSLWLKLSMQCTILDVLFRKLQCEAKAQDLCARTVRPYMSSHDMSAQTVHCTCTKTENETARHHFLSVKCICRVLYFTRFILSLSVPPTHTWAPQNGSEKYDHAADNQQLFPANVSLVHVGRDRRRRHVCCCHTCMTWRVVSLWHFRCSVCPIAQVQCGKNKKAPILWN